MKPIEYFFVITLAVAIACGFIFTWHTWSRTRSRIALVLAIVITVLVAVITAFSLATLVIHLLSL